MVTRALDQYFELSDSHVLSINSEDEVTHKGDIHHYDEPEEIESIEGATKRIKNNIVYQEIDKHQYPGETIVNVESQSLSEMENDEIAPGFYFLRQILGL